MKRLVAFDFDATLIDSPEKESGILQWKEKTGQHYPHVGWWGRKESLNTDVFDIRPFPNVLAQLNKEKATPDTQVVILTSRMEKLRPEVENILDMHNIVVDDVLLKRGGVGKGEVLLKISNYNPDLEEIVVYDDFMHMDAKKVGEFTDIRNKLPDNINYQLMYVDNDNISPLNENKLNVVDIINEEIKKFN